MHTGWDASGTGMERCYVYMDGCTAQCSLQRVVPHGSSRKTSRFRNSNCYACDALATYDLILVAPRTH